MNARRIFILLACLGVILMASTAMAGSMHSHGHVHPAVSNDGAPLNHLAPQAVSPFEAKLGGKGLHCELLGHSPLLPCPHHKVPAEGKKECSIANECGGGPFQGSASRSIGDSSRYLIPVVSTENNLSLVASFISQVVFYDPFYSHSLDRPPRAL